MSAYLRACSFLKVAGLWLDMAIDIPETLLNYLLVGSLVIFFGFLILMVAWSLVVRIFHRTFARSRLYFIPEILRGLTPSVALLSFLVSLYFAILFTDVAVFDNPLFKVWGILVIFIIVNIIAKILLSTIDLYYKKVKSREIAPLYRSLPVIKSAAGFVLYTLALVLSIQVVSAEAGYVVSVLAILAVLFFFIIFYEQIRSIAAGFQLTSYYIEEGDLIELGKSKGFVEGIYGRSTVLRTLQGKKIAVPNYMFFKKPLIIHANTVDLQVQVKGMDTERIRNRISSLATKTALALQEIPNEVKPQVFLMGAENVVYRFAITVKLAEGAHARKVVDRLGKELASEFKEKLVAFRMV